MAVTVYAWPPVGAVGTEWTVEAPVSVTASALTGADYTSRALRRRRVASLRVNALTSVTRSGAGYMEVLKDLLDGGANLVRLVSYPVNRHYDDTLMRSWRPTRLGWTSTGSQLYWGTGDAPLDWYVNLPLPAVPGTEAGWPVLVVSGLPAAQLVVRAGEFLTVTGAAGATETVRAMRDTWADEAGVARVRLMAAASLSGEVMIGTAETAVFRPAMPLPRSVQPVDGNWSYDWEFSEVFADEVSGGFFEVDPWS